MTPHPAVPDRRPTLRDLLAIVRRPVGAEARALLEQSWTSLAPEMRVPQQMYGRQGNGCGATIGAMPRCDFACRGCYLNAEANRVPPEPVDAIKAQMRRLRPVLGHAGNLQLTDGEVTLRPEGEVIELLRYARALGLVPMLMTHGDSFRRRPGLLERLVTEGGLSEVSIHVDTTQRGRQGERWRAATTEAELNPLRAELAALVRDARRRTGRPLRAATTMTVTRDNVDGVRDVVRWLAENPGAFFLLSLQPIAQVGRTEAGYGGGVGVEAVWDRVADGLGVAGGAPRMRRMSTWFGHEACTRLVYGTAVREGDAPPAFHPLRDGDAPDDARVVDDFLARFGGISFRLDGRAERTARLAGLALAAPGFVAGGVVPYAARWLRRVGRGSAWRAARRLATGATRAAPLAVVSHHFMSRDELATPLGRERLAHCIFQVPVDGELMSMCEVNALGVRERYYAQLVRRARGADDAADGGRPAAPVMQPS